MAAHKFLFETSFDAPEPPKVAPEPPPPSFSEAEIDAARAAGMDAGRAAASAARDATSANTNGRPVQRFQASPRS